MSLYTYDNQDPSYPDKWKDENVKEYKEAVFERISQLLIEKFTEIEPRIVGATRDGSNLKLLQKTIRDREIQVGIQSEDESIIIYQSDIEANREDKGIMETIFRFFNFVHPMHIDLEISDNAEANADGIPSTIKFQLKNSGDISSTLIVNELVGLVGNDIENIKLKDNVSQFIEISKIKTNMNTNKLPEYVDTTFTEIKSKT